MEEILCRGVHSALNESTSGYTILINMSFDVCTMYVSLTYICTCMLGKENEIIFLHKDQQICPLLLKKVLSVQVDVGCRLFN